MNHKYRKTVIAANWKMNKTPSETRTFGAALKRLLPKGRWCDVVLCMPAICIPAGVKANLTKSVAYMLRVCLSILFIQWFRKKGD